MWNYIFTSLLGGVTNYGEYGTVPFYRWLRIIYERGSLGVEFFFLVAGLLVDYNYYEKIIHGLHIRKFLCGRASKIYIPMMFSVLIGVLLSYINGVANYGIKIIEKPVSIFYLFLSLVGICNGYFWNEFNAYGSGTWFIDLLFLCYLLWAIVAKYAGRLYKYLVFLLMSIGIIIYQCNMDIPFMFQVNGRAYYTFFAGVLINQLYREKKAIVLWGVMAICSIVMRSSSLVFSLVLCPVLLYIARNVKLFNRLFSSQMLHVISRYTMYIYLLHVLIISSAIIFSRTFMSGELNFGSTFIMLVILAVTIVASVLMEKIDRKIKEIFNQIRKENR